MFLSDSLESGEAGRSRRGTGLGEANYSREDSGGDSANYGVPFRTETFAGRGLTLGTLPSPNE